MIKTFLIVSIFSFLFMSFSCKENRPTKIQFDSVELSRKYKLAIADSFKRLQETKQDYKKVIQNNGDYPIMTFENKEHNFGTIDQGDKVNYTFRFKNTGKTDLLITNATSSCGCTIPEYPKEPIKPGKSSKIKVSFNSAGKKGLQMKTITLTTNTINQREIVLIKASIQIKPEKHSGITSN